VLFLEIPEEGKLCFCILHICEFSISLQTSEEEAFYGSFVMQSMKRAKFIALQYEGASNVESENSTTTTENFLRRCHVIYVYLQIYFTSSCISISLYLYDERDYLTGKVDKPTSKSFLGNGSSCESREFNKLSVLEEKKSSCGSKF
jgi:hypothetical protein